MTPRSIDARLLACLDEAHILFCVIGSVALAIHGCTTREGDVELLTVDADALRPLFWESFRAPEMHLGESDDQWLGRLRWDGARPHELIVGKGHAMVYTCDTAKQDDELGHRVATPLGLVLLALERGGPASMAEIIEVIAAQERRLGQPWQPAVGEHLQYMSAAARASWQQIVLELGSR